MKIKRLCTAAIAFVAVLGIVPVQNASASTTSDIIKEAKKIAADNRCGYSQSNRWGPNYDCSSFVITSLKRAGVDTNGASCSSNIRSALVSTGEFTYHSRSSIGMNTSKNLKKGDILLANGHVELYAGNGMNVGAHTNYDGRSGDSTGKEICVKPYRGTRWYGFLRYKEPYKKGDYKVKQALNVRETNDYSSDSQGCLLASTEVTVTKVKGKWGKISSVADENGNMISGWVNLTYCKKI